ncbi:MAG: WD40/YVTN/BNR-like repeat-containing protein [Haloglomus sp.]
MNALLALEDRLLAVALDDAGATTRHLSGHRPECLASSGNTRLVGTFDDGLWRASREGDELGAFERVAPDTLPGRVTALARAPGDPDVVYLGAEPSAVYRSDDGGETWTECAPLTDLPSAGEWSFPPRPDTHHVRTMAVHPEDPDRLYVGIEAGAFVLSDDGGEPDGAGRPSSDGHAGSERSAAWTDRPPGSRRDNHTLATHPDAPDRVYAAAGDGYAQSADAGATWNHPTDGLQHGYVWGLAVDPADPDRVYVSAARGAHAAHYSGRADAHVYRREGDGPWQRFDGDELGDGLPVGEGVCRAVLAAPAPGEVLAANNRGLFHTTDSGATFECILDDIMGVPRSIDVTNG